MKCRFINFITGNCFSKNDYVSYLANLCFKNVSSFSGGTVSRIMTEYNVDFNMLDHPKNIIHHMKECHEQRCLSELEGEEWKVDMILEIVDCMNGISECNLNDEESMILLDDICTS